VSSPEPVVEGIPLVEVVNSQASEVEVTSPVVVAS
jgi:hypothetical protein